MRPTMILKPKYYITTHSKKEKHNKAIILRQEDQAKVLEEIKKKALEMKASNSVLQDEMRLKAVIQNDTGFVMDELFSCLPLH